MFARTLIAAIILMTLAACRSQPTTNPDEATAQSADDAREVQSPQMPEHLAHITFSGGDGTSCDAPVVIHNATNTNEGISAENAWIQWKFPGAQKTGQELRHQNGRSFDIIKFTMTSGEENLVCFDISGFFGKW